MARVLSVFLSWWPIERRRRNGAARDAQRAMMVVRTVAQRQIITHACPRSIASGVREGLTLAQAKALIPWSASGDEPYVFEHDEVADRKTLESLARWAHRYTPLVTPDGSDGLWLDVTGCARVFHGEGRLVQLLQGDLSRFGLTARLAIAPTHGAAWALARYGSDEIALLDDDTMSEALDGLPVGALNLDDDTVLGLDELGLRRIGELRKLSRAQLPARFSTDLLLRLDQMFGRALDPLDPVREIEPCRVEWVFAGPVKDSETIRLAARQLLDALSARLLTAESGVRRLRLTLDRYEADPDRIELTLSRPSRDAKHVYRLLEPRLERVNLGHGVEGIELHAIETTRIAHRQRRHGLLPDHAASQICDDEARARLLDTLVHRLGRERVLRFEPHASHRPERSARLVAIDHATPPEGFVPQHHRPSMLLPRPEPIDVQALSPDGPVLQIHWRREWHRVVRSEGPERLTCEWWLERSGARDYFAVRIEDGRQMWLYRDDLLDHWFLHGVWA